MRDFNLRELQFCELDVLQEFTRICEKYHLQYYLAWGTCLGAVRHKGFIPWDDDIDVCMPWEDYLKFKQICQIDLHKDFFYEDWFAHHDYFLFWAKLRRNETTCMTRSEKDLDIHWGVGIDIFPLFKNDTNKLFLKKKVAYTFLEIVIKRSYLPYGGGLKKKIRKIILTFIPRKLDEKIIAKCLNMLAQSSLEARYIMDLSTMPDLTVFDKDVFSDGEKCRFEDGEFIVPTDADRYLKQVYGDDYMRIPEVHERVDHGDIIVDLSKDYSEYK